ncbi:MAG TPA: PLP-dependent aminotransferase family protein [Steroidobacteraceae bacterium]|nr:PLP-dependent aminotransferase family protein [Steroidobacteraceae bacterium]
MPKKRPVVLLVLRPRAVGMSLFRWLYDEIRTAIIEGRLPAGARLPSTRSLALQYRIARGTVVAAFDQLCAEEYLASSVGSGTVVREILPDRRAGAGGAVRTRERARSPRGLSARGRRLSGQPFPRLWSNHRVETFRLDRPALDCFPMKIWSRIAARHLRKGASIGLLGAGETLGFRPLREAIAGYIGVSRGVKCTADQVLITSGTQQSLDLIARLVLDAGDRVWMEDPGYTAVSVLLRALGAEVIGVPVDAQGLDCEAPRGRARSARLAYVTAGCQFPLGVSLSLKRRLALLRWAEEQGAWIFEDDYDSQLSFSGRPLAALQSLDTSGSVVYSNSFNKMLFTSLRIGFLVMPAGLVKPLTAARSILDRFPSILDQATLCDFISAGYMEQHMRRMRDLYASRFDALVRAARSNLEGLLRLAPTHAGLQIVGWLDADMSDEEVSRRAAECGIDSVPLSRLTIDRSMPPGVVLGVGSAGTRAIHRGVKQLQGVLRKLAFERRRAELFRAAGARNSRHQVTQPQ